jgi:hypothetical protein
MSRVRRTGRVFGLVLTLGCAGCPSPERKASPSVGEPSPNASILPAPLAATSELEPRPRRSDHGSLLAPSSDGRASALMAEPAEGPPRPLREDEAPASDALTARDGVGATLDAEWHWLDLPGPAAGPDVDADGLKAAREKTALTTSIDLAAAGRMRVTLTSPAFPLAYSTELRAREDRFGHVLVWPDGSAYRVVPKGGLRALFAERRVDVTPLTVPKVRLREPGTLLGMSTTKLEVATQLGQLILEQASVTGIGDSGQLLCRLLLEIIGAAPTSSPCGEQRTPLRAEFRSPERPRLVFEVTALARRADLPIGLLYVPPIGALFKPGELPPETAGVFLTRRDLQRFRSRDAARPLPSSDTRAPAEGITAVNRTDALQYLFIDGVPVAWLRPHSEKYLIGPRPGRYVISWRDFLGVEHESRKTVEVPARLVAGRENEARAPSP